MLVTEADDKIPESSRLRLHRIPAIVQSRRSTFHRIPFSSSFTSSGENSSWGSAAAGPGRKLGSSAIGPFSVMAVKTEVCLSFGCLVAWDQSMVRFSGATATETKMKNRSHGRFWLGLETRRRLSSSHARLPARAEISSPHHIRGEPARFSFICGPFAPLDCTLNV